MKPITLAAAALSLSLLPAVASAKTVRCFGVEGGLRDQEKVKTVELTAKRLELLGGPAATEYTGQGDVYSFHAMVTDDGTASLAITTKQLPVGLGANAPLTKLSPLSKAPVAFGLRVEPTSLLTLVNPADEKSPLGAVGCGTEE